VGTLSVSFSLPLIGRIYDRAITVQVASGLAADSPAVQAAAGLHALGRVAILPVILVGIFLGLNLGRRNHRQVLA
jgi:hypothetical protein